MKASKYLHLNHSFLSIYSLSNMPDKLIKLDISNLLLATVIIDITYQLFM